MIALGCTPRRRSAARSAYLLDDGSSEPGQAAGHAVGGVALEALAHEGCVAQERSAFCRTPWRGVAQERLCVSSLGVSGSLGVREDPPVADVGESAFEAATRLVRCLRLGELAPVVLAPGAGVAGLADGHDVNGGVELAVTTSGESVMLLFAAGDIDRGGAGVAGVVLLAWEASDVAGVGQKSSRR